MSTTHTSDPGPSLPEVAMHLHKPNEPATGVLVESHPCTNGRKAAGFVRHVVIDVSRTRLKGNFRVGQSFGVIPPGQDERGPQAVRAQGVEGDADAFADVHSGRASHGGTAGHQRRPGTTNDGRAPTGTAPPRYS